MQWKRRITALAVALCLPAIVAGCGQAKSAARNEARVRVAASLAPCSSPAGWSAQSGHGQEIRKGKAALEEQAGALGPLADAGDWAYQSLPVDVPGDGDYTLEFGPLRASFNWPGSPSGFTLDQPPSTWRFHPVSRPRIVSLSGGRYLEQTYHISRVDSPCSGLIAWIY